MNASAVGKKFAEVERAYLAGLIDGDGCIMATIEKHSEKKFGYRIRVEVKITQKESILLNELFRKYKMGRVARNRSTFDWIVRDKIDGRYLLEFIRPYTKSKRDQVDIALQILAMSDSTCAQLLKAARLADALSKFNVRSKNRRKNYATMIKADFSSND